MKAGSRDVFLSHLKFALCLAAVIAVMNIFFGTTCPIHIIFGLECPFCGMTRAHLAAVRLDFQLAFAYNPLFPLGIPYLLLLLHEGALRKRFGRLYTAAVIMLTAAFAVLFAQRLINAF